MNEYNRDAEAKAFCDYCSEIIRNMNNNIASALGGSSIKMSWQQVLNYKPETRTADDIKSDILSKLHAFGD